MKYIIANWKAYITDQKKAVDLAMVVSKERFGKGIEVVLCAPFVFLPAISQKIKKKHFSAGVQNIFWENEGAYTGETTLDMLQNFSTNYVILGHSERRKYLHEDDDVINRKVKAALSAKLRVVLCIGEREREVSGEVPDVVARQIENALLGVPSAHIKNLIITYEPVWAISGTATSVVCSVDNALSAILYIRKIMGRLYGHKTALALPVLYGGSVSSENVKSFTGEDGIDGVLVGRASTEKKEFIDILRNC